MILYRALDGALYFRGSVLVGGVVRNEYAHPQKTTARGLEYL